MNSKDGSPSRKVRKYENDDIPQEKVVRIYQEELAKIMGRRLEESMRGGVGARPGEQPFPGLLFPHFMEGAGGLPLAARSQDDIRLALDTYHRELAKLNMAPSMDGLTPPVGLPGLLALQQQALAQQAHAMVSAVNHIRGRSRDSFYSIGIPCLSWNLDPLLLCLLLYCSPVAVHPDPPPPTPSNPLPSSCCPALSPSSSSVL